VNRSCGDFTVDLADPATIETMFSKAGPVDAIICAAGGGSVRPLVQLTEADFELAIGHKVMDQINLLRLGVRRLPMEGRLR